MKNMLLGVALSVILFATFSPSQSARENSNIFVHDKSLAGVKCEPSQRALWVVQSGKAAGVYRCSAQNAFTREGVTNTAGTNVVPKSDGSNLIPSSISDDGSKASIRGPLEFYDTDDNLIGKIYKDANAGTARVSLFNGDGVELYIESGDGYLMLPKAALVVAGGSNYNPSVLIGANPGQTQPILQLWSGGVPVFTVAPDGKLVATPPPVYANNAAAIAGGLSVGTLYRTGSDPDALCIVH
jgi:hypothetical protein